MADAVAASSESQGLESALPLPLPVPPLKADVGEGLPNPSPQPSPRPGPSPPKPGSPAKEISTDMSEKARINEAIKLKNRYLTICGKADSLITLVQTSSTWSWAKNPEDVGGFEDSVTALKAKLSELGVEDVIHNEMHALKRSKGSSLSVLLTTFQEISAHVVTAEEKHKTIMKMQVARQKTVKAKQAAKAKPAKPAKLQ